MGSPGPCSECGLVRNTGATAINLAGWKLDAGDRSQRFSLASYPLKKGATVRIHTGRGTTRAGHLFLGSGRPIWNNDGDTGTLIDLHNTTVSRCYQTPDGPYARIHRLRHLPVDPSAGNRGCRRIAAGLNGWCITSARTLTSAVEVVGWA